MKFNHSFIFQPGQWVGQGIITFSTSPDRLRFYTKWTVQAMDRNEISSKQEVEMEDRNENLFNYFTVTDIQQDMFLLQLSSDLTGVLYGKGIISEKTIAWEFRGDPEFEGFEVYELQDNGDYMVHAEYFSDDYRTIIDGRIWQKQKDEDQRI